ncbi:MAG: CRISPR-associated helicase Cas3' [Candidatus Omnitrophota bacterium]
MTEFYSHAIEDDDGNRKGSKLLKNHLQEVGNAIKKLIIHSPPNNLSLVPELGYLLGIAHDFGKYTIFFQDYLFNNIKDTQSRHHHGLISAIFASYLAKKCWKENDSYGKYMPLLFYFVALHHHGDLNALELDLVRVKDLKEKDFLSVAEPWRSRLKALQYQFEDISKNLPQIQAEYAELLGDCKTINVKIEDFLDSWLDLLSKLYKLRYQLIEKEDEDTKLSIFITILFLYSLLIDADKKDAANVTGIEKRKIPGDLVDKYRESSSEIDILAVKGINGIRSEIYRSVVEKISKSSSHHIFTFTAPTGTGKTLASFSCALKLREQLEKEKGYVPRIIYSLPFTSIIDQNYEVIRNVLSLLPDFRENENAYLIKHHHLADLNYKVEDEERPISESLLLVESWESEIIVTTFIQLLHTIIGFKNRFLKKFHNIAGSIILLDEVQNIPVEYWDLINRVFKLLVKHLNCYIILLTATKPLIFDESEVSPLLDNYKKYFKEKNLDRVTLNPDVNPKLLDEFFQKFKGLYDKSKSYLIVLNTIKSSIIFHNMLKDDAMFKGLVRDNCLFYLSANIIPRARCERIEKVKGVLREKRKIIVVSTQVVEAGVDIDLDIVVRDIGPIDSIVQVAGRCNRGMNKTKGVVYVFNLVDNNTSYAKYVYGNTHFAVSHVLLDGKLLEESQFSDLIDQYFNVIKQKKNQDASIHIWDAIKNFCFYHPNAKSISDFELIKEKYGYVDLFVEINKQAKELLAKYIKEVVNEKNFHKRQNNYFSIQKDFKSYIISVPKKLSIGLGQVNEYLLKIPYEQLGIYYKNDTGFKRIEDNSFIF